MAHAQKSAASGLGLWAVRPGMHAHACSYVAGAEGREFPPCCLAKGPGIAAERQ